MEKRTEETSWRGKPKIRGRSAFQIPEELFRRIKEHLETESRRRGIRLTRRDFVPGLIEQASEEAERESARTEETASGEPDELDARSEPGADSSNGEPEAGEDGEDAEADSADSEENAPAETGEDADNGDGVRSAEWN